MKYFYILSSLPLVSEYKLTITLQNLQHLVYQVTHTGISCTNKVSGYSAVVTRYVSTANCGEFIQLVTPNAEVLVDIMCSSYSTYCIFRCNMEFYLECSKRQVAWYIA